MDLFYFPYHTIGDEYPESSSIVRFGNGYMYASKPTGPDQLIFHLTITPLFWWMTQQGEIDWTANAWGNAGVLQKFYEAHRLYEPFQYNHPTRGLCTVRFSKPLLPFRSIKEAVTEDGEKELRGHQIEPVAVDLILLP